MVNTLLSLALQIAIVLALVWLVLLLVGGKWKNAKPAGRLYNSMITTTLMVIGEFLWRPRLERQGGAQLSLPQIGMEDYEDWDSNEDV